MNRRGAHPVTRLLGGDAPCTPPLFLRDPAVTSSSSPAAPPGSSWSCLGIVGIQGRALQSRRADRQTDRGDGGFALT